MLLGFRRLRPARPFGFLLGGFLAMAGTGCEDGKDGPGGGDDGPELEGLTFYGQSVTENGEPRAIVEGTTLTLSFREGGRVGASAGCNGLDGAYAIDGDQLVISEAGWTEIGCDPATDMQETWYFNFLLSSPTLAHEGDDLTLVADGTEIVYLDKEVATPDLELVGPLWTVDTILDGETASSAAWSELATLQFSEDGTVAVATGCNTGAGDYAREGDSLTFEGVGVTEEACDGDLQQMLEDAVLRVLYDAGPVTLEIDASRLTLELPDGAGLSLTAG